MPSRIELALMQGKREYITELVLNELEEALTDLEDIKKKFKP